MTVMFRDPVERVCTLLKALLVLKFAQLAVLIALGIWWLA